MGLLDIEKLRERSVEIGKDRNVSALQRGRTLRKRCSQLYGREPNEIDPRKFYFIFVSDKYKLLYCHVPKVASTTIGKLFMFLEGETNKTNASTISGKEVLQYYGHNKRLNTFTETEVRYRLQHYTKLVMVREPFEILVSAFTNKLLCEKINDPKYCQLSKKILHEMRQRSETYKGNKHMAFEEFLQFLILENSRNATFDQHWAKYTDLCYPCHVQYNYVGNYETFDEDINMIRSEIGAPGSFMIEEQQGKSSDLIKQYIEAIPRDILKRVNDIYVNDTFLFDYHFAGL